MKTKAALTILALGVLMGALATQTAFAVPTPLAITVTGQSSVCNADGTATVTITYQVTSGNASGASLALTVSNGNVTPYYSGTVSINAGLTTDTPAGDWVPAISGPVKTYTGTLTLYNVPNGTYIFSAEVDQTGGNSDTVSYTDANPIIVNCVPTATSSCDQFSEVVGQVVGNKNLCKNSTPINIVFKGLFGDVAQLTVAGPGGPVAGLNPVSVPRNGDSCVYNYQWIPAAGLSGGTYNFDVSGDGRTLHFTADLICKK
jgi:hypothetical protein